MRVGVALTLVGLASTVLACGGRSSGPELRTPQDLPADVVAELATVERAFRDVFAARLGCVDDVTILLVADVEGGDARYLGATATIEIQIPTSPARFRDSVVHELAHHVERTCPDADRLRDDLVAVVDPSGSWEGQERWEERPSEQWAEAVVELVLGERVRYGRRMPLDDEVLDAARAWIAG